MTRFTRRRAISVAALAALSAGVASERRAPSLVSSAPAPTFRRGISIHHALNWPSTVGSGPTLDYVWPPFRETEHQLSDGELDTLRAAGFDFIRLTVDPSIYITALGRRGSSAAGADRDLDALDAIALTLARRILARGFGLIFDLHPVAVNPAFAPARLVASATSREFEAYAGLVEHIARMLADIPVGGVAFELMNEPGIGRLADAKRWQAMLETLHSRARAGSATLPLLLSGCQWDSPGALRALDVTPFAKSNVFYTFHYYEPFPLTHQGVHGMEGLRYLSGVSWPPRETSDEAIARSFAAIDAAGLDAASAETEKAAAKKALIAYFADPKGPRFIEAEFARVANWARGEGIPNDRIILGEFGATRPLTAADTGWLTWLSAVRSAAEAHGFAWAYWAYRGWGGMELAGETPPHTLSSDILGVLMRPTGSPAKTER